MLKSQIAFHVKVIFAVAFTFTSTLAGLYDKGIGSFEMSSLCGHSMVTEKRSGCRIGFSPMALNRNGRGLTDEKVSVGALSVVLRSCRLGHLTECATPREGCKHNSVRQFEGTHLIRRQQGICGPIHRLRWRQLRTFSWHCARHSQRTGARLLVRWT